MAGDFSARGGSGSGEISVSVRVFLSNTQQLPNYSYFVYIIILLPLIIITIIFYRSARRKKVVPKMRKRGI